jgi:sialate O-acetylesterase
MKSCTQEKRLKWYGLMALVFMLLNFLPLQAEVRLAGIFSSEMVLQRNHEIVIWGWADKGERVSVSFNQLTKKTKADANGKWKVVFPQMDAGGPYDMKVQGKNIIALSNILIGDIWICSGQSNMGFALKNANDADKEIAAANYPSIRIASIPRTMPLQPMDDIKPISWQACSPETIPDFSAVAYFFGRSVFNEINVPIGLINTSWGGTNVEAWTSLDYLTRADKYRNYIPAIPENKETKQEVEVHPNKVHTSLFNGMINPILDLPVKGVIWYQGESNAYEGILYRTLFPNMIQCWRDKWKQPDLPFLFVQLANYTEELPEPAKSNWAMLREAQLLTLTVPNTAMSVAIDVGDAKDIHPKNKQDVGYRLSRNALKLAYGKAVADSGPIYQSKQTEGNKIILSFKNIEGGLVAKDKYGYLKSFAVAGEDKKFYWAKAMIKGDQIVVYSDHVANPAAVRYAWADNPGDANLYNTEGLPASPFRTDDW